MRPVMGTDYSTFGLDAVILDAEGGHAHWRSWSFDGTTSLERARAVRSALPSQFYWRDAGVVQIAIEQPMSRGKNALIPLMRTLGAIHACLPDDIDVWELTAVDWRRELGLKMTAKRAVSKAEALAFASMNWVNPPLEIDTSDNVADAFCIAWAARSMAERGAIIV
jgi:hypothetical protein